MNQFLSNKQPQNLEFSYETMCHTKISPKEYEVCIAIPQSKKYVGYITLCQEQPTEPLPPNQLNPNPFYPILIIYELNRFRKISGIHKIVTIKYVFCEIASWMEETIFYGSLIDGFFIIEDVLYYKGTSLRNLIFKEKIEIMMRILSTNEFIDNLPDVYPPSSPPVPIKYLRLVLPVFFKNEGQISMPQGFLFEVPYPIHHIQYRSISTLKPILNVSISKIGGLAFEDTVVKDVPNSLKLVSRKISPPSSTGIKPTLTYGKPQYKKRTVFEVMADIQYDVYSLYAYNNISIKKIGVNPERHVFVDVALISTFETSKMMNSIFRKIKENENLDYIEESDDEEDFENSDIDKYVDLKKKVNMECQFNYKFKKWVPIRVIENTVNYGKIAPISNL